MGKRKVNNVQHEYLEQIEEKVQKEIIKEAAAESSK